MRAQGRLFRKSAIPSIECGPRRRRCGPRYSWFTTAAPGCWDPSSVGSQAFQHDLIEIAGGQNLFRDIDRETIQPALEEVISRKPDIIIETLSSIRDDREIAQRKKDWENLGLARARVYIESE